MIVWHPLLGHTCHELFSLRTGKVGRIPDLVVWPRTHNDVEVIVQAALKHNVCLIPFGGEIHRDVLQTYASFIFLHAIEKAV